MPESPSESKTMPIASAPAKVILFGEHAVVYGEPSLAGAIDKRIFVTAGKSEGKNIDISSGVKGLSFSLEDLSSPGEFPYVRKAVELIFDRLGSSSGLRLRIDSEIPYASGLGSSASVSVATILAVSKLLGAELSKEEIAELGHRVELEVQGAASPTDTATVTFGGILFIQPKKQSYERLRATLPLVVGYTGVERSTKELVQNVRAMKDRFPELVDPIIEDIGMIVREAKERLEGGEDIGQLMNINHGLLEALGVSTDKLNELVYAARHSGAEGAKLTGAGGGGCMIAYAPKKQMDVLKAIEACGCTAMDAPISNEGVRLE